MIYSGKTAVFDIDGTLCKIKTHEQSYLDVEPYTDIVSKLIEYHNAGVYIILYTSRQMRTYEGNVGKINANTAKTMFEWLDKYKIPYDEIHFGKPWCAEGFYVDDKAVRPSEIAGKTYDEVVEFLAKENAK
jgi:capsule biosynthesis phosphatase